MDYGQHTRAEKPLLYSERMAAKMSRKDIIEELERELRQRGYLYPRAIARGNLGTALAIQQYTALRLAIDLLTRTGEQ